MNFWIGLLIGLAVGGGGCYAYFKKSVIVKYELESADYKRCAAKLAKVYEMLSACHHAIWGPVGLSPGAKKDLFNKLWDWAGLPQNGVPLGR
jgi:hypothetical protein